MKKIVSNTLMTLNCLYNKKERQKIKLTVFNSTCKLIKITQFQLRV